MADSRASDDCSPASGAPASSVASTLAIGARIGRYVILAKLGEGGMGEVYSAFHEQLERRVALKVVHARFVGDGRARMQREALALARLSHPNVVQAYDVGEFSGQLFVAMEYVKGETLRAWQARNEPATPAGRRALLDMYIQAGRGLAAAHAAGMVHRDFKPDNVMIGDDGRARVFDFGLAAARRGGMTQGEEMSTGASERGGSLGDDLTRTGSILGTPAYMAPEQFLGQTVDLRADIFAFSIALYQALYGEMPFDGETFAARQQAVLAGAVREAPPTVGLPLWLRAVLLRGLAREPAARYPSMDAMLRALADDPGERQRQRLRLLGLGLAAVAIATLLIVAGLWGWERWQQRRGEAQASERLAAVELRIDELLASGATTDAERVFTNFVSHPDNRGTAALGRAWLHRAGHAQQRDEVPAVIDALVAAYTVATSAEDQTAALVGLARILRDEMLWPALILALDTLEERRGRTREQVGLDQLRLDATLGRRDLGGAVSLLRGAMADSPVAVALPVLTALRPATRTPHQHRGYAVVADLDGDGRPELVFETNARDRQLAQVLRATPQLDPLATVDLGKGTFEALSLPGRPGFLISTALEETGRAEAKAVLRHLEGDKFIEVFRWPAGQIRSALGADVDGDGVAEILVGSGPYTRQIVELIPGTESSWSTRSPAPDIDRRSSDVVELLAADLDGDGRVEVAAALGPWAAYELHILRHDPASATLRTVTRRRLGNIAGAALVRDGRAGAGPEIAVSKTDEYPSTIVFPRDRPYGEPAGTYLFRLVDQALVQTGFAPAPRLSAGERVVDGPPIVGDLDGDGSDEIVVCRTVGDARSSVERDVTVILVRAVDGALTPVVLGELRPIAALDLDGDGDDELIVGVTDGDDRDRVWVLGSGEAELPTSQAGLLRAAAPLTASDPVLSRMLRHADDLARMGLVRQSAANLATIAETIAQPELRAQAELRAAELYEAIHADAPAAELYAQAAKVPALAARASEGATRSFLRLGRIDAATAHLGAFRPVGDATPSPLAAAIAALGPGLDFDFDHPLAPNWRIDQALALRRDGARKTLHIDALLTGELLSAPIDWPGRSLMLEVDLDLTEVEWGAGLEIGLVPAGTNLADGSSPIAVDITTTGGGSDRTHEIGCVSYGRRQVARIPFALDDPGDHLGRFRIRAILLPDLGEWTCEVVRASGEVLLYRRSPLVDDRVLAPLRLTTASRSNLTLVAADIHMVRLHGASFAAPEAELGEPALIEARRRLVEDDALGALASLARAATTTPADRFLGVVALARLGRLAEAGRTLGELLTLERAALLPLLTDRLRIAPAIFGALLRDAAGPAESRALFAQAWRAALEVGNDPLACAVAWAGLAERDLDTDTYNVLRAHALAAKCLGHHDAATASFRAALHALDDPRRFTEGMLSMPVAAERLQIHFELAAVALLQGDEQAARRELRPYVEGADADPSVIERLRAREDLRVLWDLAPG